MQQSKNNQNRAINWWTSRHLLCLEVVQSRISTLKSLYKYRRNWVKDFCKRRAGEGVYLSFTNVPEEYLSAGIFDHSLDVKQEDRFVEIDTEYVALLCQTEFALCPAGDQHSLSVSTKLS